ncbi:MAG: hypothetical protein Q9208_007974, partial [Pyrenodesmia sp. 3 TL-2023]
MLTPAIDVGDVRYMIFPIRGLDNSQGSELDILIKSLAINPETVYVSKRPKLPVPTYWGATLSEAGFDQLKGHRWTANVKQIQEIFPNEELVEQFADYTAQSSAPEELRVISQPPGPEPISRYHDYVYRSDSQKQVFIYHAELGINANHVDFGGRPVEWLYTNQAIQTGNDTETESPFTRKPGHSTCTASKAVGSTYGSSRLATLVVVKTPDLSTESTGDMFSTIADHILEHGREGRSVISVSWGSKTPVSIEDISRRGSRWSYWRTLREGVVELYLTGSIVLFAAGNAALQLDKLGRERRDVDTAPATFAEGFMVRTVFVVSNVENSGRRWRTSQRILTPYAPGLNIFAPGVQVKCAAHDSNLNVGIKTGTSF